MIHLPPSEIKASETKDEAVRRIVLSHKSKQPRRELIYYGNTFHELLEAVARLPPEVGGYAGLPDKRDHSDNSQVLLTETDVTLPSCLVGSPGSEGTEADGKLTRCQQLSCSCQTSFFTKIYQEMITVYEQLKAERQTQRQRERELQEREMRLKQQEEALGMLTGLEERFHTHLTGVKERHQQEVRQLQNLLREKNKDNRRLRSSFDIIRTLNDSMKKQLSEISERNQKLERISKRVQARLENLQTKYELRTTPRGCCKESMDQLTPLKKEKAAASRKPSKDSLQNRQERLLAFLLDWILDGQMSLSIPESAEKQVNLEVVLNDRCVQVLPLLVDQLHHPTLSEPILLLSLLRFIHWIMRRIESCTQYAAMFATLRRLGEALSTFRASFSGCEDPHETENCDGTAGRSLRNAPLDRSPCPHTRILSTLIILRTVTRADVLTRVLENLHTELLCKESRGLFIHYGGVQVLLSTLQGGHGGLKAPINILMQLSEESRYLNPFLEACSCEEFFKTASRLLKDPHLDLALLEKLSVLLQKLSNIRKNRHLFGLSALHLQIQELHRKADRTHTFLHVNLASILHNLKPHV